MLKRDFSFIDFSASMKNFKNIFSKASRPSWHEQILFVIIASFTIPSQVVPEKVLLKIYCTIGLYELVNIRKDQFSIHRLNMDFIVSPEVLKIPVTSPKIMLATKLIVHHILSGIYHIDDFHTIEFEVSHCHSYLAEKLWLPKFVCVKHFICSSL
jgi:hypothetical protein